MSSIAKPFISSSTAVNSGQLIPVEGILSMDKTTINSPGNTSKIEYLINFRVMAGDVAPRDITLRYQSETVRDTAFTNIKNAICTTI